MWATPEACAAALAAATAAGELHGGGCTAGDEPAADLVGGTQLATTERPDPGDRVAQAVVARAVVARAVVVRCLGLEQRPGPARRRPPPARRPRADQPRTAHLATQGQLLMMLWAFIVACEGGAGRSAGWARRWPRCWSG